MKLLLIDDDAGWCTRLITKLEDNGFKVFFEADANNAMKAIKLSEPEVVLLDILFEVQEGAHPPRFENRGKPTFDKIKEKCPDLPVIILTSTMKDSFSKKDYPGCAFAFAKDQLSAGLDETYKEFAEKIKHAVESKVAVGEDYSKQFGFVVGKAKAMREVCDIIRHFAPTGLTILITGESGTGKELAAKDIHEKSDRKNKPYVAISCHDIPDENMLKSALFGYEKGAFTGAGERRAGIFEMAQGGTVFVDEIGDAPLGVQQALLRVLQEKVIRRLGGSKDIKVDIRVVAATNKNLSNEIQAGKFRSDLFYRLHQSEIRLPPLRERKMDIPELLAHFVRKFNKAWEKNILIETKEDTMDYLRADVLEILQRHDWPGNIREFENEVAKAMVNAGDDNVLMPEHFSVVVGEKSSSLVLRSVETFVRSALDGKLTWEDLLKRVLHKDVDEQTVFFKALIDTWCSEKGFVPKFKDLALLFYPDIPAEEANMSDEEKKERKERLNRAEGNIRQKITKVCGLKLKDFIKN